MVSWCDEPPASVISDNVSAVVVNTTANTTACEMYVLHDDSLWAALCAVQVIIFSALLWMGLYSIVKGRKNIKYNSGFASLVLVCFASLFCVLSMLGYTVEAAMTLTWDLEKIKREDQQGGIIFSLNNFSWGLMGLQGAAQVASVFCVMLTLIAVASAMVNLRSGANGFYNRLFWGTTIYACAHFAGLFFCMVVAQRYDIAVAITLLGNLLTVIVAGIASCRVKSILPKVYYVTSRVAMIKAATIVDTIVLGVIGLSDGAGAGGEGPLFDFVFHIAWFLEAYWYLIVIRWLGSIYLKKGKRGKRGKTGESTAVSSSGGSAAAAAMSAVDTEDSEYSAMQRVLTSSASTAVAHYGGGGGSSVSGSTTTSSVAKESSVAESTVSVA